MKNKTTKPILYSAMMIMLFSITLISGCKKEVDSNYNCQNVISYVAETNTPDYDTLYIRYVSGTAKISKVIFKKGTRETRSEFTWTTNTLLITNYDSVGNTSGTTTCNLNSSGYSILDVYSPVPAAEVYNTTRAFNTDSTISKMLQTRASDNDTLALLDYTYNAGDLLGATGVARVLIGTTPVLIPIQFYYEIYPGMEDKTGTAPYSSPTYIEALGGKPSKHLVSKMRLTSTPPGLFNNGTKLYAYELDNEERVTKVTVTDSSTNNISYIRNYFYSCQ